MESDMTLDSLINRGQGEIKEIVVFLSRFCSNKEENLDESKYSEEISEKKHSLKKWTSEVYSLIIKELDQKVKIDFILNIQILESYYRLSALSDVISVLQKINEKKESDNPHAKANTNIKEDTIQTDIISLTKVRLKEMEKQKSKVFIVHGHNDLLIEQTKSLVWALGFEPIVLKEQPNKGLTIIEKFEEYSDVEFAIILYTACDEGRDIKKSELKPRARQNVVFEHGYFCSELGRNKVCALVQKSVEIPGDYSGVVYIEYDDNGMWRYDIAKEMKAAGMDVDLNKI